MWRGGLRRAVREARRLLRRAGIDVVRAADSERLTQDRALERLVAAGLRPATVLDVGAALGDFAELCARHIPGAHYVLVEPQQEFEPFLRRRERALDAEWVQAAAGSEPGVRNLRVHHDMFGTSLFDETEGAVLVREEREVPVVRLDALVAERSLEPPFLLKVDVQGGELEALRGATELLPRCDAVLVEASLYDFFVGGPTVADLVAYLTERGFALFDVVELKYRPLDGALAQVDLVFVPRESRLRGPSLWQTPEQREASHEWFSENLRRRLAALDRD